jgi:hypothetical protein
MEFLACSDARIEQLRGERTANLDQGHHVLVAALELPWEQDPLLGTSLLTSIASWRRVRDQRT